MKAAKLLSLIFATLFSATSHATVVCEGKVKNVAVNQGGLVRLVASFQTANAHFSICSLTSQWEGISEEVCKVWVSQAQISYSANRTLSIFYPDGTVCATVNTSNPKPEWLILKPDA